MQASTSTNKVPLEIKILAIIDYAIIFSSCRKYAKKLSMICKVSKSSVNYWVRKFAKHLSFAKQVKEFKKLRWTRQKVSLSFIMNIEGELFGQYPYRSLSTYYLLHKTVIQC